MTSVADLVVTHIDTYWDPEITPKPKIAKVIAMPIEKQVGESILVELLSQRWDPINSEYSNEVSRLLIRIYTNKTDTRLTDFANEVDRIFANYSVSGYDVNNVVATDDVSQRQSNFFQTKTLELTRLSVYRGTAASAPAPAPPGWGVPATYIIFKVGTTIYAKNGITGLVDYNGTDASTVIQSAVNSLTNGRTWQETVVLKGDLGNVHDVEVPNYTRISGNQAKLTLPAGSSYIFKQKASDLYDVTIEGIVFETETPKSGTAIYFFYFYDPTWAYCYNLTVRNCKFTGFQNGIYTIVTDGWFSGNRFYACVYGIQILAGHQDDITDNNFYIGDIYAQTATCFGVLLIDVTNIDVIGNHFIGLTTSGQTNVWGIRISGEAYMLNIAANTFAYLILAGITLNYDCTRPAIYLVNIEANIFYECGNSFHYGCVFVGATSPTHDVSMKNNVAWDCYSLFCVGWTGETIANDRISVSDNTLRSGSLPFQCLGAGYSVVLKTNEFYFTSNPPILGTGTLVARDNIGYPTENSGTSTGTGVQETIPHGLASIPNRVYLTANDAGISQLNENAVADATNIYPICTTGKKYTWRAEKV